MTETEFGTFFVPGPTEVRQEVLDAMRKPMIPHRSAEFEALFVRLQSGLRDVFQTQRPVLITSSSATGMMEAGVRCAPAGRMLCLVNGAFSERFAHIAEMCGRDVDRYEVPWGHTHDASGLDNHLTSRTYTAITVVHSETSTGALNPVRAISDQAHRHGVMCLVDSVSGAGGAELMFDQWKLDYVLTGSQKALALPPGLAFSVASEEFMDGAARQEKRGVYFDLVELNKHAASNQVPSTPSLSLLYALEAQLMAIAVEGIEARWHRHALMAAATQQWLAETQDRLGLDWRNIVAGEFQSPTISTIQLPPGTAGEAFVDAVLVQGIRVAHGYGKLRHSTFRIGHMGDHTPVTLQRCLDACERAISA